MTDYLAVFSKTRAYKLLVEEKAENALGHAYLFVSPDAETVKEFLTVAAKIFMCAEKTPCGVCRACRLIDSGSHPDVAVLPRTGEKILTEDVNYVVSESYVRPLESDKRLFLIRGAENMNDSAQNKLLKTLEEPPAGVHILLGATNTDAILPTVKSRAKKIEISAFCDEDIINALKDDCPDTERLREAVLSGDGTIGKARELYSSPETEKCFTLVKEVFTGMKSSKDLLKYSTKITAEKVEPKAFFSAAELFFSDMQRYFSAGTGAVKIKAFIPAITAAEGFNLGSATNAVDKTVEAQKRLKYNANPVAVTEWFLFHVLEGRYKWQKL